MFRGILNEAAVIVQTNVFRVVDTYALPSKNIALHAGTDICLVAANHSGKQECKTKASASTIAAQKRASVT